MAEASGRLLHIKCQESALHSGSSAAPIKTMRENSVRACMRDSEVDPSRVNFLLGVINLDSGWYITTEMMFLPYNNQDV